MGACPYYGGKRSLSPGGTNLIEQHENCRQARQSLLDIISALKAEIAGCHAILIRWHTVLNAMIDRIRGRDNGSFV